MKTNSKSTDEKPGNQPIYHAYSVNEEQGRWTRLGAVFAHQDAQGATMLLDALPIVFDGRIILRAPKAE